MTSPAERKLLLVARILVTILPLSLIGGRLVVEACITLTAMLFIARSAVLSDWSWLRRTWLRFGIGLWLWMLFISNFAMDVGLSYSQALPWLRFLLFVVALETWVLDETWMRRLLWVATGALVFTALDTWLQYFLGSDLFGNPPHSAQRLTGPFDRPRVGIFIAKMMFPVVLGAFVWQLWRRNKIWTGGLFAGLVLLLLSTVFISGERMALLLALLGLVFAALVQKGIFRKVVISVLSLGMASAVILILANPSMRDRQVSQTLTTLTHLGESHYGRIWDSSLHLIRERPLLGVGMKNFRIACPELDLPLSVEERCATHPHNLYLEWLTESGVPGLIGFLLLIYAWAQRIRKFWPRHGEASWLAGPAIALLIQLWPLGPTGSFFSNWSGGMFWLAVGWSLAAARRHEQTPRAP